MMAFVEEGEEVIYRDRGCPAYASLTNFLGATPVPIRLREEKDFRFDVNEFADLITNRTRLVILNSPHNPTGGVLSQQDLRDIASAIGDRDIMVLSDEIYSRLIFDREHHSIISLDRWKDRTVLLAGFSKTYAMTVWRLGYALVRPVLATHFSDLF